MEDLGNVFNIEELENLLFKKILTESFKAEHNSVYYKAFKMEDLFDRCGDHIIKSSIKVLDSSKEKDNAHTIACIAASSLNNGVSCWLNDSDEVKEKKRKGFLTVTTNCYVGCCFYQDNEFVSTGDNNYLIVKDSNFCNELNRNKKGYYFLSLYLTLIYHNKFHSWTRKLGVGNDFSREIILLPCYRDVDGIEHISVKTLEYLYSRITFNEYKIKIEKLERERSSIQQSLDLYKNNIRFEEEKKKIFYRAFKVGDLFKRSTRHQISESQKQLPIQKNSDRIHDIAIVDGGVSNGGIRGWVSISDLSDPTRVNQKSLAMVIGGNAGTVFFHPEKFVSSGSINQILDLQNLVLSNKASEFMALLLTKVYRNKFHGFERFAIAGNDFNREIILLPCYEDNTIATSRLEELYDKTVIKSKENQLSERESDQCSCGTSQGISNSNIKISVDMLEYLYLRIQVKQFNEKEKQLQEEITSSF